MELETLIDSDPFDREAAPSAPSDEPRYGHYYTIKPADRNSRPPRRGDTLFGIVQKLMPGATEQERLAEARRINDAPYNVRFRDAKLTDNGLFPRGRISFSPAFSCDLAAQQMASDKAPRGRCFATILIPPPEPRRLRPKVPGDPRPARPPGQPALPPLTPRIPMTPRVRTLLPQARYRDLPELRRLVRDDLWVLAEASSLLGGKGRTYEWSWTIYKVVEKSKPIRYGVTRFEVGERSRVGGSPFSAIRERLGLKLSDQRVQLVEHGHTHPINSQSHHGSCGEDLSALERSETACRVSNAGPAPCGDKALVLRFGEPEAVITPSGRYIRGVTLLKSPLVTLTPQNRRLWHHCNVRVATLLEGQSAIYVPRLDAAELKKRLAAAIEQLRTEEGYSPRAVASALRKLDRWTAPRQRISRSCRKLITRLEAGTQS